MSDLKEDFVSSSVTSLNDTGLQKLGTTLAGLLERAQAWFTEEQAPVDSRQLELTVDARYVGQNFELAVPVATGSALSASDVPAVGTIHERFCAAHETAYGYASAEDPVEIVNVRLTARARLYQEPELDDAPAATELPAAREHRQVYFEADNAVEAAVYAREELQCGHRISGPAVIEQLDTTTPIYPGDTAEVTPHGHLIVTLAAEI